MALAAVAVQWPLWLRGASLLDEGYVLAVADAMRGGRRLYTDLAVYQWPGVFALAGAAFEVFGTSLAVARAITLVVFAVAAAALFRIACWSMRPAWAAGVVAAFLAYRVWAWPQWQILGYAALAMSLALVATACTGAALARGGAGRFALAGAVAGGAALAKQDCGLAMAGMLAVAVWLVPPPAATTRLRRVAAFAAGTGAALAAGLGPFVLAGTASVLVRETLVAPTFGAMHFDYLGRPALWPLLGQDPALRRHAFSYLPGVVVDLAWLPLVQSRLWRETAVLDVVLKLAYHLPWMLVLATAPLAWRDRRGDGPPERPLLVVWCSAVAAVAAFNPPRDWAHLVVLLPPVLLLAATVVARIVDGPGRLRAIGRVAVAGALAGGLTASGWVGARLIAHYDTPVRTPRGTLRVAAPQAPGLQGVVDALAVHPGAPAAVLPYHPLLAVLAGRPVPSRWPLVWPVEHNAERDAGVIRALEAAPDVDVVYTPMQMPYGPRPPEYAPTLFRYLADAWSVARVIGGDPGGFTFLLLERTATPHGTPLLPALAAAPVRAEPASGGAPRPLDGAAGLQAAGEALWPARRVLRMSTLADAAVAISIPLVPPPGARFVTEVGTNPERLGTGFVQSARVAVSVVEAGSAHEVFAALVDPVSRPEDRHWRPVAVDLSPWAGRPIELVLRVSPLPGGAAGPDVVGWDEPRLVPGGDAQAQPRP